MERELDELELAILQILADNGPMTKDQIMSELRELGFEMRRTH